MSSTRPRRNDRPPPPFRLVRRLFLACLVLSAATSCAINPVTGEREFVTISEDQEIQIGQDADRQITQMLGLYEDAEWQRYFQELGERMAADSERPDLPWTFRVVDDPVVNAFAVPGGYIYMTRGILAHFSSEAELAGVLGHEIGHVTARHSVQQISRAQLAQIGLGLGTILAPELETLAGMAGIGLQLLFLSYGRDAERQADELGLGYMTDLGYDPAEMAATFEMLAHASGAEDGQGIPGWLSTHPDPLDRRDWILQQIEEGAVAGDRVEREAYLERLEGMVFGSDPRNGFFRDAVFYHPQMAFQLEFPQGWGTVNQAAAVQGVNPDQNAALVLMIADAASAREARDAFVGEPNIAGSDLREGSMHGLTAAEANFRTVGEEEILGTAVFVEHGGRVFQILGYAMRAAWNQHEGALRRSIGSFQPVSDPRILNVEPMRIELVRTDREMTLEQFVERHPSSIPLETVAVINRVREGDRIPAGTVLKRVVGSGAP